MKHASEHNCHVIHVKLATLGFYEKTCFWNFKNRKIVLKMSIQNELKNL